MTGRTFPSPTLPFGSRAEVLLGYLDHFRGVVADKVGDLSEHDQRRSLLPSGWSPLELAWHLLHMERRWLVWGFEGASLPDPWGDARDGRWHLDPARSADSVLEALAEQGRETARVVRSHDLDDVGAPGPRWDGEEPATLERVVLHVLQEYARHVGHLDVVREMIDGTVGE